MGLSYLPMDHWDDWWQNQDLNPGPTPKLILFSLGHRISSTHARASLRAAPHEAPAVKTGEEMTV